MVDREKEGKKMWTKNGKGCLHEIDWGRYEGICEGHSREGQ